MKPGYLRYCLLCCFISFGSVVAQVAPDSNQIVAWRTFNDRNENKWSVRWDKQTGTPGLMYGPKSVKYSSIEK